MENENKTDLRLETEQNEEGNITVRRNKTVDFIAKIICLLLAFFLWYYAASFDTTVYEEEFVGVSVEIVNKSGFSVLSGDGVTVNVTLSGTRSNISKIDPSDIRAYVDVSDVTEAGKYTFDIKYEVPNGVTFEKSSSGSLAVYLDNTVSKTVPVEVNVYNYNLESDCELRKGDVADIVVTGPAEIVNSIEYAELPINMNHEFITKSITYRGEVILIDSDGDEVTSSYVKMSSSTVTAEVSVIRERKVPVVVKFKNGILSLDDCSITLSTSEINVKGDTDTINSMVIECVIDEKTLKHGVAVSCGIGLPSSVQNLDGITSVSVTVKLKNSSVAEFTVSPDVINGKTASPVSPITVKVRGSSEYISRLTADDIKATVDLNGITGTSEAEVEFTFSEEFASHVYEIYDASDPYTVTVTVVQ